MSTTYLKPGLLLLTTGLFISAFIVNLTSDQSLYNQNLNIVPNWQRSNILDSSIFLAFMNLISTVLDPPVCAGYLALLWLFSSRRLEIMVFLLWFIFLSWVLSVMKSSIHQPRPFWQPGSAIEMNSWVCYTEFGQPSGHSWMGIILMQFLVRFAARGYPIIKRHIYLGYLLILLFQCTVMFSRVILGMHTFNQILFGVTAGMFSIALYYTYLQSFMIKLVATLIAAPSAGFIYFKEMETVARKRLLRFIAFWFVIVISGIDILVFALVNYQNAIYLDVIQSTQGCEGTKLIRSFQYRCLQDMAIMMAGVGMAVGLIGVERPGNLVRKLAYSRCSSRFLGRVLLQLALAGIPLIVFVNPLWYGIEMEVQWLAVVLWACQSLAFFLALFLLVYVGPILMNRLELEEYSSSVCQLTTKKTPDIELEDSGDEKSPPASSSSKL